MILVDGETSFLIHFSVFTEKMVELCLSRTSCKNEVHGPLTFTEHGEQKGEF